MTFLPEVENTSQLLSFLLAAVVGAVFCIIYDIFRVWRKIYPPGKLLAFFQDILFWLICAVIFFCFLIVRCDGQIRAFALLGALLGFYIFRKTLSHITFYILFIIIKTGYKILHFIIHKIFSPVFSRIISLLKAAACFISKKAFLFIKWIGKLISGIFKSKKDHHKEKKNNKL